MNKKQVLEIAQIASIISNNICDTMYEKFRIGYIATTYMIAEWALEFYELNKDTDWEDKLDKEGCWDDCIIDFAFKKLENCN